MTTTDDRDLYEREYFNRFYLNDARRDAMYKQEYWRILSRSNFGSVLDVGCGVGGFLSAWDDRWTRYGYDPSEFAAEIAAKRGLKMVRNLESTETETMNAVVFRGTLQHIAFPMSALAHATRVLKPGGLLAILATPDTDSFVYQIFGNLPALDAPRNWILFGHRMLKNILVRLGYTDIEILHPYRGTPYANPPRDFAAFCLSLFFGYRKFAFPGNMMEIFAKKK